MERVRIKKIILHNFESWSDGEIPFSEGFNAIVGASCSGKSSILRAIRAVTTPRAFCQGWVREGYPFCTIRIETTVGWLEAEKGEGINKFNYFIDGETPDVVKMKAPAGKEFDIAKRILGVDTIRIETVGDKKKNNSKVDVNLMRQSEPLGLLAESGKNKAFLFDTICGIEDSEGVRDGLKTKLGELKKKQDELISSLSQVKLGGIPEKKVQDAREEYNALADSFDDIDCMRKTLIEIMDTFSISDVKRSEIQVLDNSLLKDYWLPDGGIIDLFRINSKKWVEALDLIESSLKSWESTSKMVQSTDLTIQGIKTIPLGDITEKKYLVEQLFHVEQFVTARVAQETIELKIDSLGAIVETSATKELLHKKNVIDEWVSVEGQLTGLQRSLEGLAVVCDTSKVRELLTLLEDGRVLYKSKVCLEGAVSKATIDLRDEDYQIGFLNQQKKDLLSKIDVCPVTGRAIGEVCSVFEMKGKE
jgi:DNA repair exonuclease SbcCD ATPase subunit